MRQEHIFIDTETSSLDPMTGEVIEIAAIRTNKDNEVIASYTNKIRPNRPVDKDAARVNGYNEKDWEHAIPFDVAINGLNITILQGRTDKYVLVAHQAPFDRQFIEQNCKEAKIEYPFPNRRWIDTVSLSWPLIHYGIVESLKLDTLCNYFGIVNEHAHTATGDVQALMAIYFKLMRRYELLCSAEQSIRRGGTWFLDFITGMFSGENQSQTEEKLNGKD